MTSLHTSGRHAGLIRVRFAPPAARMRQVQSAPCEPPPVILFRKAALCPPAARTGDRQRWPPLQGRVRDRKKKRKETAAHRLGGRLARGQHRQEPHEQIGRLPLRSPGISAKRGKHPADQSLFAGRRFRSPYCVRGPGREHTALRDIFKRARAQISGWGPDLILLSCPLRRAFFRKSTRTLLRILRSEDRVREGALALEHLVHRPIRCP